MKACDIVRIKPESSPRSIDASMSAPTIWPECYGQIGVIVGMARRLHIPAVKVMVLGEIAEFDLDELEVINETR